MAVTNSFAYPMVRMWKVTRTSTIKLVATKLNTLRATYMVTCVWKLKRSAALCLKTFLRFMGKLKKNADTNPTALAKNAEKLSTLKRKEVTPTSISKLTTPTNPKNTICARSCLCCLMQELLYYKVP